MMFSTPDVLLMICIAAFILLSVIVSLKLKHRNVCIVDLFTKDGSISSTRFWETVGKFTMTLGFLYYVFQLKADEWLWFVYGGIVIGHRAFSSWLETKSSKPP